MIDLTTLGTVTSEYGFRDAPTAGASTNHKGLDIVLSGSSAIPSISSGQVSKVGYDNSRGNYISILHADGTTATYMHMAKPSTLKAGSFVAEGQSIGIQGSTGVSTGDHVHIGIQNSDGSYINPRTYMKGGGSNVSILGSPNPELMDNESTEINGILGNVAVIVTMLVLVILAVWFFLKAFDIKIM